MHCTRTHVCSSSSILILIFLYLESIEHQSPLTPDRMHTHTNIYIWIYRYLYKSSWNDDIDIWTCDTYALAHDLYMTMSTLNQS